VNKSELISPAR